MGLEKMEKRYHPSASTTSGNSNVNNSIPNSLRVLNKSSHKISKPSNTAKPHQNLLNASNGGNNSNRNHHTATAAPAMAAPPPPPPLSSQVAQHHHHHQQQQQPQPPVYNINKNDFREVVQKLTGSPAHHPQQQQRISSPPPVVPPAKPAPSSRLQKIRPPPLANLSPCPPPPPPPPPQVVDLGTNSAGFGSGGGGGSGWMRHSPLSPLPPFPTVSAAAESPISAYMRCLHSGSGLIGVGPSPHQQVMIPSPGSSGAPVFPLPPSPLPFGCMLSPRSAAYPLMLSPGLLFPPSPRLPLSSPR